MQDNRKQMIINEIIYWKKNHLLPEHYCDFLLAIYTEGEGIQEKNKKKSRWLKKELFLLLFIPIILFLFYFTELSLILQLVIAIILILIGIYLTFMYKKRESLFQIPLIVTALILLFSSVKIALTIYPENVISLYIVLGFNCLLWLAGGWRFKQLHFTLSGILGILLLILSLFK
ncbi:hypothetical protein [Niallia endozanthoxylica]|uniref:Uncharacterized protein n=1 Tax=Niallia endozanthoxylica TaxID=2036016 RepID=A0A5J5HWR0_9BACI|nr:hypothetical protein [Niallia endozanthoxylica]KAA9026337.1 hypothetical protein F4V44_10760 [Niallia endozanthoxylica]